MKAITVEPGNPGSARCEDIPEPDVREGSVLIPNARIDGAVGAINFAWWRSRKLDLGPMPQRSALAYDRIYPKAAGVENRRQPCPE